MATLPFTLHWHEPIELTAEELYASSRLGRLLDGEEVYLLAAEEWRRSWRPGGVSCRGLRLNDCFW